MALIALLWGKVWKYIAMLGALLAALGSLWLWGRNSGKKSQEAKTANAEVQTQVAQANNAQLESRHETDAVVAKLPDAPAQTIATAAPDTAAGELRDDGFTRD